MPSITLGNHFQHMFTELLPGLLEFLRKSGITQKQTFQRYEHSLRTIFQLLEQKQMDICDIEGHEFEEAYLEKDGLRRKSHLKNLKNFLYYKGFLSGVSSGRNSISLDRLQDSFLQVLARKRYKPKTIANYRRTLDSFTGFCSARNVTRLDSITRKVIYNYQTFLFVEEKNRYCFNKKLHMLSEIRVFLKHLFSRGFTLIDFSAFIEIPKEEKKVTLNLFKREEIMSLFSAIDTKTLRGFVHRTIFEIMYATGIRINELCSLNVKDAGSGTLVIRQGKGSKDRVVPLTEIAEKCLNKYIRHIRPLVIKNIKLNHKLSCRQALFLGRQGGRLNPYIVQVALNTYQKKAGLKTRRTCHAFRYSCATHMLENGADIRYIGELLGHKNLSTTGGYTKVSTANILRAITNHPREKDKESMKEQVHFRRKQPAGP